MKSKKGNLQKCSVCLFQFKEKNLDKHMHSRVHHEAVDRLKGGQELHRCWACDMYVPGLQEYKKHIATLNHIKNMGFLKQKRCRGNGFKVDYTDEKLTAICAMREQRQQALKRAKEKEKKKRRKARKASQSKEQLNHNLQLKTQINKNTTITSDRQSGNQCVAPTRDVRFHSNNDRTSEQVVGWNSFYWQQSSFCNLKCDVDFTSDQLSTSQGIYFPFQDEDKSSYQQSSPGACKQIIKTQAAFQKKSQKRLLDADPSDSPQIKRSYLTDVPSVNLKPDMCGRYSSLNEGAESEGETPGTSLDIPALFLHATGRVRGQVDPCLSLLGNTMEKNRAEITTSTEEARLKPVVNTRLNTSKDKKNSPKVSVTPQKLKNTGRQQAKIKRKLSLLTKASGRTSPAASSSNFLKGRNADQREEEQPAHSQRSLTKMLTRSVSKMKAGKPNLNIARWIRPSQRPVQSKRDSRLLKPAVQKLISSKGWRKVYQEHNKRNPQRDKYKPRFDIELVNASAAEPLELVLEEVEDFAEGFQWKSINPGDAPGPSTAKHDGDASNLSSQPLQCTPMKSKAMKTAARRNEGASGTRRNSHAKVAVGLWRKDASETQHGIMPEASLFHGWPEKFFDFGTQQFQSNDERIQQEVRTASNKNIQNVSKRKVSELLAVFQREDELNICLEDVNNELLLHHTALQAAFRNVQYLLEMKQQITAQMSSLRAERIAILRRMQTTGSQQVAPGTSRQQQGRVSNHSV